MYIVWMTKQKGTIDDAPVYHSTKTVQDAHVLSSGGTKRQRGRAPLITVRSVTGALFFFIQMRQKS
jgi:hypothetical protein